MKEIVSLIVGSLFCLDSYAAPVQSALEARGAFLDDADEVAYNALVDKERFGL